MAQQTASDRLRVLVDAGIALSSQLSLDVLLQRLVDTSAELAGARCAANTDLHVVGTIFDRAWVNGDMTQFQQGVQTVGMPAGGGAVFDVKLDEPGLCPFVSHAFAHVDLGQVGLLKIGNPTGTSTHQFLRATGTRKRGFRSRKNP